MTVTVKVNVTVTVGGGGCLCGCPSTPIPSICKHRRTLSGQSVNDGGFLSCATTVVGIRSRSLLAVVGKPLSHALRSSPSVITTKHNPEQRPGGESVCKGRAPSETPAPVPPSPPQYHPPDHAATHRALGATQGQGTPHLPNQTCPHHQTPTRKHSGIVWVPLTPPPWWTMAVHGHTPFITVYGTPPNTLTVLTFGTAVLFVCT